MEQLPLIPDPQEHQPLPAWRARLLPRRLEKAQARLRDFALEYDLYKQLKGQEGIPAAEAVRQWIGYSATEAAEAPVIEEIIL